MQRSGRGAVRPGGGHTDLVPTSLRVMTFNVRQLKDDTPSVAGILRATGADVVAVQEPPRGPLGAGRLRRLARAAGYEVAVAGGGARTTALLVRSGLAVTGGHAVRLAWRPGRTGRGLAIADVAGIRVVSVHLSLDGLERARHLHRLLLVVRSAPGHGCVVAGDLNERPGGPTRARLALHLRDLTAGLGPTFPSREPGLALDAVLATSGLAGSGARVVRDGPVERASDHLPVVVDVRTA